ncbi:IclR family transcriptional regulator [Roseomonas sp. WA12]
MPLPSEVDRATVPTAVRKSFRILEIVADSAEPVASQELAGISGLTRSTLSRLVLSLEALGYLERAPTAGWRLGPAALRLGLSRLSALDIREVAVPLMRALSQDVDLPVDLAMPIGEEMLHFELAQKAGHMVLATGMGARLPIITTALGHAALYAMEKHGREDTIQRIRRAAGADWPRLEAVYAKSCHQLQHHGFCVVRGLLREDVAAVGTPFVDPRTRDVFSFSCSAIGMLREPPRFEEEIGPKLVRMVAQIVSALGGRRAK